MQFEWDVCAEDIAAERAYFEREQQEEWEAMQQETKWSLILITYDGDEINASGVWDTLQSAHEAGTDAVMRHCYADYRVIESQ